MQFLPSRIGIGLRKAAAFVFAAAWGVMACIAAASAATPAPLPSPTPHFKETKTDPGSSPRVVPLPFIPSKSDAGKRSCPKRTSTDPNPAPSIEPLPMVEPSCKPNAVPPRARPRNS